jgi:hypothetical protein
VPNNLIGWVIMPIGIAVALWILWKKVKGDSFRYYLLLALVWLVIAVVFDYFFLVQAFKPAEDGIQVGLVVRLWNFSASPAAFTLTLPSDPIVSATHITHIETPIGTTPVSAGILSDTLTAQQIKTYSLILDTGEPTRTSTNTSTPSKTSTRTTTQTATNTRTPSRTNTHTPTNTVTPNRTSTRTSTSTPTGTPTSTPSPTRTPTPTLSSPRKWRIFLPFVKR